MNFLVKILHTFGSTCTTFYKSYRQIQIRYINVHVYATQVKQAVNRIIPVYRVKYVILYRPTVQTFTYTTTTYIDVLLLYHVIPCYTATIHHTVLFLLVSYSTLLLLLFTI